MASTESVLHFIHGGIAGSTGVLLSHPIDTVKSRIQKGIRVKWGIQHLYKGFVPPLFGVGLEKSIVFGVFQNVRNLLSSRIENKYTHIPISGAVAGFASSFVVTPIERLKILRQTESEYEYARNSRIRGKVNFLYRGLSMTFIREMPGFAIYFTVYEFLKDVTSATTTSSTNTFHHFIFGAASGTAAWAFIYPQDLVKTQIQANTNDQSIARLVGAIYKEKGLGGFFKGFHLALLRAIPLHAGTFAMFEFIKTRV
jgi:solute carrier family 25 carnitine/acylcarnitine transporter 20/29